MTREDIERMAHEVNVPLEYEFKGAATKGHLHPTLYRFAALVAAAEREASAEYAAALAEAGWSAGSIADALRAKADALRARGET